MFLLLLLDHRPHVEFAAHREWGSQRLPVAMADAARAAALAVLDEDEEEAIPGAARCL